MKYVCVTLVGGHKLYSKKLFFEYIMRVNVLPREIWVSTTKKIYDEFIEDYKGQVPLVWVHGENDKGDDRIASTTAAREALRQKIITSRYDWSLWLDNDMLVPPDLVEKFRTLLRRYPDLLMVNAYHPARQDDCKIRHGLGSSFISKEALTAYPFTMAVLRGKNLGDDYIWKMVMGQLAQRGLPLLSGYFFDVKHLTRDGRIKEFLPEYKRKLL